jgi:hypothetical protein
MKNGVMKSSMMKNGMMNGMMMSGGYMDRPTQLRQARVRGRGGVLVARSYDGRAWEAASLEVSLPINCSPACSVTIPADGAQYVIEAFDFSYSLPSNRTIGARFLTQTSFGPTKANIEKFDSEYDGDFEAWIQDEMTEPATLHRAFWRQHANPRFPKRLDYNLPFGTLRSPCAKGSRWNNFAFTFDDVHSHISIAPIPNSDQVLVSIDGIVRTEAPASYFPSSFASPSMICHVLERISSTVRVGSSCQVKIKNPEVRFTAESEPTERIAITADQPGMFVGLESQCAHCHQTVLLGEALPADRCDSATPPLGPTFLKDAVHDKYYIADPRAEYAANTLDAPAVTAPNSRVLRSQCPTVKKTFLNAHTCVTGVETCAPIKYSSAKFTLNDTMIRGFYADGRKHVHYITGLTTDTKPCNDQASRWIRRLGTCSGAYSGAGVDEIVSALSISKQMSTAVTTRKHRLGDWKGQRAQCRAQGRDLCTYADYCPGGELTPAVVTEKDSWVPILDAENEWVQIGENNAHKCRNFTDRYGEELTEDRWGKYLYCCGNTGEEQAIKEVRLSDKCSAAPAGSKVMVGDECWEHVHPNEEDVYDFTRFIRMHRDKEDVAFKADPVAALAMVGKVAYEWPLSGWKNDQHRMSSWDFARRHARYEINLLGRRGDVVDFVELADTVQVEEMARRVGAEGTRDVAFESCGSPGEVANVPVDGNQFQPQVADGQRFQPRGVRLDTNLNGWDRRLNKQQTWYNIALKSKDQLRQRMAWALAQIFVIGESGVNIVDEVRLALLSLTLPPILMTVRTVGALRCLLRHIRTACVWELP